MGYDASVISRALTWKNAMASLSLRRARAIAVILFLGITTAVAQMGAELQLAELTKELQLSAQQEKALAPIVAERDQKAMALMADTSMGRLQKLRKAQEIQKNFREQAAKVLTPDQVQKLEALQAERRAKLIGS